MVEPTDRDLVLRTRRGEVEAFGEVVVRYQQSVFNVCHRMLGERMEAEDLAQETFISAYRRLETFYIELPFGSLMRRVATNVCLNQIQGQKPESYELDEDRDRSPAAPGGGIRDLSPGCASRGGSASAPG